MVGFAVNEILSKFFFSLQDSKTPMRNSIISMIANIVLAYILFRTFKTPGLALAAAFGSIINALLNAVSVGKKFKGFFLKSDWANILKIIASSAFMGVLTFILYSVFEGLFYGTVIGNIILLGVCAVISVVFYFGVCYLVKVDILKSTLDSFIQKK